MTVSTCSPTKRSVSQASVVSNALCIICDGKFFERNIGVVSASNPEGIQKHKQCYECSIMQRDPAAYFKYEKVPIGLYKGMTYQKLLDSKTNNHRSYVRFIQRLDNATDAFRRLQLYMADDLPKKE